MSWLTKLRTHLGYDENDREETKTNPLEAQAAYDRAKQALDEARGRREETRNISIMLSDLNRRNHYGESIMLSMMPKEGR